MPVYTATQLYKKVESGLYLRSPVAKRKRYWLWATHRKSSPVLRIAGMLILNRTIESTAPTTSVGINDQFQRRIILHLNTSTHGTAMKKKMKNIDMKGAWWFL